MNQAVYVVDARRTPVGKAPQGRLRNVRPDDLLAHAIRGLLEKNPSVESSAIEDCVVGCAMPEAEQGMNVARMGLLLAGLPDTVPGVTVNRFCASGLESVAMVAARIASGACDLAIAGGTESMSMVPMGGHKLTPNPRIFDKDDLVGLAYGMGVTAEEVARRWEVPRDAQDAFALESHRRAVAAWERGDFAAEVLPYEVVERLPMEFPERKIVEKRETMSRDEGPRPDSTPEALAKLKPVFSTKGSVTAGNSSQMSDGAGAVLLASEEGLKRFGLKPMARFHGYVVAGVAPEIMGIGPARALPKLLGRHNLKLDDIDWMELNEAFAAQSLAVIRELGLNGAKVNPLGGAIALGHPLGATGSIRTATIVHGLRREKKRWGVITMCIGLGMGAAGLFENLD